MFQSTKRRIATCVIVFAFMMGALGLTQFGHQQGAFAGAEIVGNPQGATDRLLIGNTTGQTQRVTYFATGLITPVVTATALTSAPQCGMGLYSLHRADIILSGTMTGSSPTLTYLWQNSIDGGVTWKNVGTWTAIDTTSITTPANLSQSQTVADLAASTAVAYGDCFRVSLQFGGTGSVGANLEVVGFEK